MRLHCLRHGETGGNVSGRYTGAGDDPLTEDQRARLLAVRFDGSQFDAIYCSPFRRCIETAKCLRLQSWLIEPRSADVDWPDLRLVDFSRRLDNHRSRTQ